jgi:hypothetical protein
MLFENEDEEEFQDLGGKFGVCETSEECYVCTERVTLNLELGQLEIPPETLIGEEEQINLCMECLTHMFYPTWVADRDTVFEWSMYQVLAFHPDTKN